MKHSVNGVNTTLSRIAYGHVGHKLCSPVVVNRTVEMFVHVPLKVLRARNTNVKFLAHAAGIGGAVGAGSKPSWKGGSKEVFMGDIGCSTRE